MTTLMNRYVIFQLFVGALYRIFRLFVGALLQVTVTEPESERLLQLDDEQIKREAMVVLRKIFGDEIQEPVQMIFPRFSEDPLFMGLFVDWNIGFSNASHQALRAPVGRVSFAGSAQYLFFFQYRLSVCF